MLIGIDGNEANVEKRVGSNIYAYELLTAIYKEQRTKNKEQSPMFKIYLKEGPLADLPQEEDWWRYQRVWPKKFSTQIGLPISLFLSQPRPDVFFTPGHYLPRWSPCTTAMAILDTAYIDFPEMFRKQDLWQLKSWTAASVKKAVRIFTISQSSKDDIIRYYRLPAGKVVVTYLGLKMDQKVKSVDLQKYGVKGEFILYVGTLQPRKNLIKLIEAFNILISQYPTISLAIVGKKGWLYEEIFQKVKDLGLEKRVVFTGYVPDEELSTFYMKAQCFVLVSLYEGFGLPVLEAMHYGCPVVASNVSSLPEVVGQAGVLVNPQKSEEIAEGIKKAIGNRNELIKKGFAQAKKFSWEKCARETLEVLEEVGSKNF